MRQSNARSIESMGGIVLGEANLICGCRANRMWPIKQETFWLRITVVQCARCMAIIGINIVRKRRMFKGPNGQEIELGLFTVGSYIRAWFWFVYYKCATKIRRKNEVSEM